MNEPKLEHGQRCSCGRMMVEKPLFSHNYWECEACEAFAKLRKETARNLSELKFSDSEIDTHTSVGIILPKGHIVDFKAFDSSTPEVKSDWTFTAPMSGEYLMSSSEAKSFVTLQVGDVLSMKDFHLFINDTIKIFPIPKEERWYITRVGSANGLIENPIDFSIDIKTLEEVEQKRIHNFITSGWGEIK